MSRLSLAETSPHYFSLYTTGHGAREAIETSQPSITGLLSAEPLRAAA
jgi:hypothetical protein